MILDFDPADASKRHISVNNAPGNINSSPIVSAPCGAFWRPVGGLDVLIII